MLAVMSTNAAIIAVIAIVVCAITQRKQIELLKRAGADARGEAAVAGKQT
jgi:hypothetical protein